VGIDPVPSLVVARKSEEEQEGQVEGRECNMELAIAFMKACPRSGTLIQMIGLGLSDFPLGPLIRINLQWMERRRGNWTSMK
jgi:hypothetical protein